MKLSELKTGEKGRVVAFDNTEPRIKRRLIAFGITPGVEIGLIRSAPMGDPIEVRLRGYSLTLRRADAESIRLTAAGGAPARGGEAEAPIQVRHAGDFAEHERAAELTERMMFDSCGGSCLSCGGRCGRRCGPGRAGEPCAAELFPGDKPVKLALAGNPNCGKTSLFNAMTGAREYVGNWPGVTVEKKEGRIKGGSGVCTLGHDMTLVDLPGIYSLSPYSMEEIVARNFIIEEKPDAVINIVDATNLERNLYLTLQLLELERPMIIAMNMMDEVERQGSSIDCKQLALELGVPVIPISARTGDGINELVDSCRRLIFAAHAQLHEGYHIEPDDVFDSAAHELHHRIGALIAPYAEKAALPAHWASIKLLENDRLVKEALALPPDIAAEADAAVAEYGAGSPDTDSECRVADSRYRYIERVVGAVYKRGERASAVKNSGAIDRVLTNKYLAMPIFILIMLGIFWLTFSSVGAFMSDAVGALISDVLSPAFEGLLESLGAWDWLQSLLLDGVLAGVGGVLTFLPQIAVLFFCLSLLEDSGYMSRIAFIMDKPMRRFGLSGRSFIPLLMGFGCTVPAAMAARTMENMKDKRMTILLTPFMSCSAKLPVYGLIAGAFFGRGSVWVILSLYVLGILCGILSGTIFKRTAFRGKDAPFVEELPAYRMPMARNTFIHVWERVSHFLIKAGTLILVMTVVIWFMERYTFSLALAADAGDSIIGRIGAFIAPVFAPMGFGFWQAAVALISGFVAKEAVVSTFSMLFGFSVSAGASTVAAAMSGAFTPLSAYSFLVFVLLYTPCMAATAAMGRELGGRRWLVLSIAWQLFFAWCVSALVYAAGMIFTTIS